MRFFGRIFVLMLMATINCLFAAGEITWKPTVATDLAQSSNGAFLPSIAMSGQNGISVWVIIDSGGNNILQTKYTEDGGKTWSVVTDLQTTSASGSSIGTAGIVLNGLDGIAVWTLFDGSDNYIQSRCTHDGGKNWLPVNNLQTTSINASFSSLQIASVGLGAVVVWALNDFFSATIYVQTKYTSDGGENWNTPDNPNDGNLATSSGDMGTPDVAMSGQNGITVWYQEDPSDPYKIHSKCTNDGGKNWSSIAETLDTVTSDARETRVAMSGLNGIAVWQISSGLEVEIHTKYTLDGGNSWNPATPTVLAHTPTFNAGGQQIAMSGSNGIAVWFFSDDRTGKVYKIQTKYTPDGGANWFSPETGLDLARTLNTQLLPEIAMSSLNGTAVWIANDGNYLMQIQTKSTADGGINWFSPTGGVDLATSPVDAGSPQVAMSGKNAIAVWFVSDGSKTTIQTKYSSIIDVPQSPLLPPSFATGTKVCDRFAMQSYYYNLLSWKPSPSSGVKSYAIYRDAKPNPIATVSAETFTYKDQPVSKKSIHVYTIKSVNSSGQESAGYTFTVK